MAARAFVGLVFLSLLGLAALELRLLWPLIGNPPPEFTLREVGRVSLAVEHRPSQLSGLAVTRSGTVWVADTALNRLVALDQDGSLLAELPVTALAGVWADGEAVLTVDPHAAVVQRITLGAGVVREWDLSGFGLFAPRGVARLEDGTLAVAVTGLGFVLLLGEGGQEMGRLGVSEKGEPQLQDPDYPLVDRQGRVYASDRNVGVRRWTRDGQPDVTFRTRGQLAGVLTGPRQSALDPLGRLWVADDLAGRVWLFDTDGGLLGAWRAPQVPHPVGLALWGDRLYLTSGEGADLYVFELPLVLPSSE